MDISAVGAKVVINFATKGQITITKFSDEGTPFECPDVDLSTNNKNLNGMMISSRTPSVYTVSVTVVPNSDEDIFLQKRAREAAIMPGNVTPIKDLVVDSIILTTPKVNMSDDDNVDSYTWTWTNGRMKNAPTGPSTSAEGRLSARTYTFEMEQYDAAE